MICPDCDQVMHMDSKGMCSCISCGYNFDQATCLDKTSSYNNKDLMKGVAPTFHTIHENSKSSKHSAESEIGNKYDTGKLRYSLIPPSATKALASVLTFGAKKYAPNNWKLVENPKERYLDAAIRHLESYRSGEKLDSESNLPHLDHLMTNIAFLIHFEEDNDDPR